MHQVKTLRRPPSRLSRVPFIKPGLDWEASGWAGLAGGAAFLLLEIVVGGGAGPALRRIASVALGESVVPLTAPFSAIVILAAAAVHIPLSLIYARILAALIDGMPRGRALGAGALFGAVLYAVNYYALSGLFPWFALARGWSSLASHLVFGVLAAAVYNRLTRRA